MSEFTAKGLVEYCKQALGWKTVYMWGGLMKTVTQAFIDYKKKQYPKYYSEARVKQLQTKIGNYYGCDCVGLIKSYLFGGINSPKYKSKWDTNTRGMYSVSKTKGTIETLPEVQGLILYMKGHVGVYIGNGECIECTLGKYGDGVVKTKVAGRGWTHWLQLPWLDYNDGVETECGCDCPCCKEKCKKKTDDLIDVWQSPPFPNYGEPFIYSYESKGLIIETKTARGKLANFPPIINETLFSFLRADKVNYSYSPSFYIGEKLSKLIAHYEPLFFGDLAYVLGLEISGNRLYFDIPFLTASKSNLYPYSVLGLEENNVSYEGFSLNGLVSEKVVIAPNNSFVLSLPSDFSLSLRYEFGEEEIVEFYGYNLIVKKPISYTIIPSLPKVKLPNKGILELHLK